MPEEEKRQKYLELLRETIETADLIEDPAQSGQFLDGERIEDASGRRREDIRTVICERDRDVLLNFDDRLGLLRSKYSVHRHEKLLRHVFVVARDSDASVADAVDDRSAAEDCVRWIHQAYKNEETNRDYRVALRMLGKHVTDGDEIPDTLSWINAGTSKDYNPTPNPANMISRDEMGRLVDAARNPRDRALVAVAWDSGCRSGEFRDLTLGDVSDHDHGMQIHPNGKTGERSVTLIPSAPYLRQWLNFHPGDSDDAPLWSKLNAPEKCSFNNLSHALKRLKRDTDRFDKPVNLTNFRKSRASDLASRGMSQAHLEDRMGWVRGSDAASRYVAVFADQAEREFLSMEGVEVEEENDDVEAPEVCPRCDKETPRHEDVCVWCGQALDPVVAEKLDSAEDALFEHVIQTDDDELVEDLREIKDRLDDPEVRALLARGD
jgi:integrase